MKRAAYITILLLLSGIALWGQITLSPGPIGNWIVGTGYEGNTITPTGCGEPGKNACTWSVSSGALPPGLALAPDCAGSVCWLGLTGTPTTGGTFTFTVKADSTDVNHLPITGSQTYTMTIYAMTGPSALSLVEGVPLNQLFSANGDPANASFSWALVAGAFPPGLTSPPITLHLLSYPSVAITGTPTTPGIYPMTIQLTVNDNLAGTLMETQPFNIAIASSAPTTATALGNLTLGTPVATNLGAAGGFGAGTYSFSYTGTLPPGLTLSAGGSLTGTPTTVGIFGFTVQLASAPAAGYPPLTASETFTITVDPPFAITALPPSTATVGTAYSQPFTAAGGGGASTYTWSVTGGTLPPGLTLSTAGVLSGTPTATGTFSSTIQVASQVPAVGTMTTATGFTMTITSAAAPAITGSLPNGAVGTPYSATLGATGGYGAAGTYTFAVTSGTVPGGTTLSPGGALSGTPTAAGTFAFTVQVTSTYTNPNGGLPPQTATEAFTIAIYPTLAITTTAANSGTVGTAYSQTFGASGGAGSSSYTWSVLSGTAPPGLTLTAAGVLSGTPTTVGAFAFTLQVASAIPNFGTQKASAAFNVVIAPAGSLTITGSLGNGVVGVPYSRTLGATGGYGAGTYAFAVLLGTAPTGTTLSAGGVLSGTPTAAGTFTFTAQVTSTFPKLSAGLTPQTATAAFTVVIYPELTITTTSASSGTVGTAYAQTFAATGGAGSSTYAWSVVAGTLPPGLTLSAAGVLSGTPATAGTFAFTVNVASVIPTVEQTCSKALSVAIAPALAPLTITGSPGIGVVGTPYSATLGATGGYGTGSYTFAVTSGAVPTGTTLSSTGALSGTPTAAGTFTFTVEVASTNSSPTGSFPQLTATQAFTIAVYQPLAFTPQTLGPATVGTAYVVSFQPTGGYGAGTYSYTLTAGALPPGILLVGGTLSGTPTAVGTFAFTVQLVNARGADLPRFTATQSFTIVVSLPAAPPVTISGLPASPAPATQPVLGLSVGTAYPLPIQGTITLTFAPTSGADDPNVQFTTGGRTVAFQIPAGSAQAQFTGSAPGVQTGTVAGTITLTLDLTAAGTDITPTPAPRQVLVVAPSAPVITSAAVTHVSGGFNLVVIGYATTRDMTSAAITFTPAAGVTLASNTASVSLGQLFTTWYQNATSGQFGSQFSLTIPFTVQSSTAPITSLSVTLTNSQGSSAAATAAY